MSVCNDYSYLSLSRYTCQLVEGSIGAISAIDPGIAARVFREKLIEGIKDGGADFGKLFNKSFIEFLQLADIPGVIKKLTQDIDFTADHIRDLFVGQADKMRDDIQTIFANMTRDTALKVMPWVALTTAIGYGTPLAVHYIYQKAVYNIGRPKLATEVRHVNWYNRAYDATVDALYATWNTAKLGAQVLTGVVYAEGAVAAAAAGMHYMDWIERPETIYKMIEQIGCQLGAHNGAYIPYMDVHSSDKNNRNYNQNHRIPVSGTCQDSEYQTLVETTLGVAFAVMVAYGLKYASEIAGLPKMDPKPIFNPDLTRTIDEITKSTYNLQKHNGYFQNVLLYGPGGTGKTMISKVIARNSNMNYVMMSGGDLAQYIKRGEHVTELNKLFESAKNNSTPTIIFIDEAESLCRDRNMLDKPELIELLNAFLNHTGEQTKKFMIVMATNRMEDIDPAVLSRMDHKLFIAPPAQPERKKILEEYVPRFFSKDEQKKLFTDVVLTEISEKTEGLTGRALFKMLNSIASSKMASNDNILRKDMIDRTVEHFIDQEKQVEKLREEHERKKDLRARISVPDFSDRFAAGG